MSVTGAPAVKRHSTSWVTNRGGSGPVLLCISDSDRRSSSVRAATVWRRCDRPHAMQLWWRMWMCSVRGSPCPVLGTSLELTSRLIT